MPCNNTHHICIFHLFATDPVRALFRSESGRRALFSPFIPICNDFPTESNSNQIKGMQIIPPSFVSSARAFPLSAPLQAFQSRSTLKRHPPACESRWTTLAPGRRQLGHKLKWMSNYHHLSPPRRFCKAAVSRHPIEPSRYVVSTLF